MSSQDSGVTRWISLGSAAGVVILLVLFLSGRNQQSQAHDTLGDLRKEMDRLSAEIKGLEASGKAADHPPVASCKACQDQVPQLQKKVDELEQRTTLLYDALRKLKSSDR